MLPPQHEKVEVCCVKEDLVKDQSERRSVDWRDVGQEERMRGDLRKKDGM